MLLRVSVRRLWYYRYTTIISVVILMGCNVYRVVTGICGMKYFAIILSLNTTCEGLGGI